METLKATLRVLEDMRETKMWPLKSLLLVMRATKRIFLTALAKVGSSTVAAKLKNSLFNTLQTYKAAKSLDDSIKR